LIFGHDAKNDKLIAVATFDPLLFLGADERRKKP